MSANLLCFISSKGGSGKTVTSSSLGTFLSKLGFRVMLIDTDAATNGMTLLYLEKLLGNRRKQLAFEDRGLFEAEDGKPASSIEISDALQFIPASFRLKNTENTTLLHFKGALQLGIAENNDFDFIFLDAQAGADNFARAAAEIAFQSVIVSEYDPVSVQGIERLKVLFSDVVDATSTWTLFNKVLPEFADVIGEGLAIARYLPPIPWDADVVRAFARRDLAIDLKRPNPYTIAMSELAYALFPDEVGNQIDKWRKSVFLSTTAPIEAKLSEIEHAVFTLNMNIRKKEARSRLIKFVQSVLFMLVPIFALFYFSHNANLKQTLGADTIIVYTLSMVVAMAGILYYVNRNPIEISSVDTLALKRLEDERMTLRVAFNSARRALNDNKKTLGYYEKQRRDNIKPKEK